MPDEDREVTKASESVITQPNDVFKAAMKSLHDYLESKTEAESLEPLTIQWNDKHDKKFIELLKLAQDARRHVTVRFPDLEVGHITDIIFAYKSVRPATEFSQSYPSGSDDSGLVIGDQWPSEVRRYNERRYVSLISETTRDFVEELRNAILAMKKESVDPPWDPVGKESCIKVTGTDHREARLVLKNNDKPLYSDLLAMYDPSKASTKLARRLLNRANPDRKPGKWGDRPVNLLVTGDSGTGKSLVAKLAHSVLYEDAHRQRPFISVNCGALDRSSLEFRLFGGLPGSFTNITTPQVGPLAQAAYGTVFLDEFGDLPNSCQPFFLTYLEDLEISPVGGDMRPFYSYSYVIAATNRDLGARILATEFRNDLVQRFARQVQVPSLRERGTARGEILALIDMAAQHPEHNPKEKFRKENCRRVRSISHAALKLLLAHDYADGNVRELESIVHRAIETAIRRDSDVVTSDDLPAFGPSNFRPDAKRNMVNVSDLPALDSLVVVEDARDLDRIAQRSDRPILKSETEHGVIVDNVLYRYSDRPDPDQPDPED